MRFHNILDMIEHTQLKKLKQRIIIYTAKSVTGGGYRTVVLLS
jgi:hypothetical protein